MSIRFPPLPSSILLPVGLIHVLSNLLLLSAAMAQKDTGAIVGLVRDPSGAVVVGAKVTVTDVERGIDTVLSTGDARASMSPALSESAVTASRSRRKDSRKPLRVRCK